MVSSVFTRIPDLDKLMGWWKQNPRPSPILSNLHIHTPYSFSAFQDISQAVRLAREQGVLILGISDFNTTKGYEKFTESCEHYGVFPAYCIETIALSVEDQKSGLRWNDPNNPGRIYFCGKGLRYPMECSQNTKETLSRISSMLEDRSRQMIDKINQHLDKYLPDVRLDYDRILKTMTQGAVRERHLAKALQYAIFKAFPDESKRKKALEDIYGSESKVDINDEVTLQGELRSNLLKAGKVAFVEENPEGFLALGEARSIILDMGGIPCYPVLADGTKGKPTEAEKDPELLCNELLKRGVYCAEFIPTRNDINLLRDYVSVFKQKGMVLVAGTEHNTPEMEPMVPSCRSGVKLDDSLLEIFWKGACVVSAHQYLVNMEQTGFVEPDGDRSDWAIKELEMIGEAVISYFLSDFS